TRESGGPSPAGSRSRRPPRGQAARSRTGRVGLSEAGVAEGGQAGGRAGVAEGAFACPGAPAAAAGTGGAPGAALSPALAELMRAAGLVRRIGVNLNQAVTKLNATGQQSGELVPYAQACMRRVDHLDALAEQLRRALR